MAAVTGPGRPRSYINIRVDTAVKAQLEQLAAAEGTDLVTYMRRHYMELIQKGAITPDEDIKILNPSVYPQTAPPGYIPPAQLQYQPYPAYYAPNQFATQPVPPDQMDIFLSEIRKLLVSQMMAKMLMEIQKGGGNSYEDMLRLYQLGQPPGAAAKKSDDLSMQDIMKMNMVQAQIDRQWQQQQAYAQQQLLNAQSKGDKQGESKALELITALTTAQMQQQQNFMTQFMVAQQNASNVQQTMFTTALAGSRAQDDARGQERNQFSQQLQGLQQTMTTVQIAGLERVNQIQVDFLKGDLERIKNEPRKDVIAQMGELLNMRNTNPVYKAAFDAAFGVKEGGIGDILPKLKDLGVDKVIDKVVGLLGSLVTRPAIPQPTIPQPTMEGQQAIPLPGPMPQPTPEDLAKLSQTGLPQQLVPRPTQQIVPIERPQEIISIEKPAGYTNLDRDAAGERIQLPTEAVGYTNLDRKPEPKPEQPQQPAQPSIQEPEVILPTDDQKVWTTGRPKGAKNKPKEEEPTQP